MKATLILDVSVKGANVWLMDCTHEKCQISEGFGVHRIFESEDDARREMLREVQRVGMNMLEMWKRKHPRTARYNFHIDPEGYDCEAVVITNGVVVDKYYGQLHCLTIE